MRSRSAAFLAFLVLTLAVVGVGCPCTNGVVNSSPDLRWWLFSNFGASKVCAEMTKRGMPLKIAQLGAASVGRFFPGQCQVQIDDARKVMILTTSGSGYVTLPVTRRVGFAITMTVEYLPDFRLESDAMYVWGKFHRFVVDPNLQIAGVENPVVNLATQTPVGTVAQSIGNSLVASEIGKGFTVVRRDDGDDFTLGHLDPPQKPHRQFKAGKGRVVLESNLSSIGTLQRDYVGPFEVTDDNAALFLHAKTTGAAVTYAIVERSVGEAWRRLYETGQPLGPPPGMVVGQGRLDANGTDANLGFPVSKGTYYIVLENTAMAPLFGTVLPIGDTVAQVGYSVEVGDRNRVNP